MGKVTKAFSYFNVSHVSHYPWRKVLERFLIELLELCTLNEYFLYEFLMRKSTFLFGKTIFDKVLKLAEGVIKPFLSKKTLKVLTKSLKNVSEGIYWH